MWDEKEKTRWRGRKQDGELEKDGYVLKDENKTAREKYNLFTENKKTSLPGRKMVCLLKIKKQVCEGE